VGDHGEAMNNIIFFVFHYFIMDFKLGSLLVVLSLFFVSCGVNRELAYFKGQKDTTLVLQQSSFEPIIQFGDILYVGISSSDPQSSALFNGVNAIPTNNAAGANFMTQSVTPGLLVDKDGTIHLPKIGKIVAKGLTKSALASQIQTALIPYLKDPIVTIRFMNYRVTVLGEVIRPSTFNVPNERISVLEALGMTGDLTAFGNRTNVLIIHEREGKKEFHRINLNKFDLFQSPHFYLQNNDVIYVEPNKAKSFLGSETSVYLPAIISSVSLLVLVVNNFFR
jgi:polysaccharide export outer membrane protein